MIVSGSEGISDQVLGQWLSTAGAQSLSHTICSSVCAGILTDQLPIMTIKLGYIKLHSFIHVLQNWISRHLGSLLALNISTNSFILLSQSLLSDANVCWGVFPLEPL